MLATSLFLCFFVEYVGASNTAIQDMRAGPIGEGPSGAGHDKNSLRGGEKRLMGMFLTMFAQTASRIKNVQDRSESRRDVGFVD